MVDKDLWAIIPCYNEGKGIISVIKETKKFAEHVIVVDDGSEDNSYDIAVSAGARVLRHMTNLGLGDGLKTGCDFAVSNGAKYMVTLDSDGQHDPVEIPKIAGFLKKGYDIVFGVRPYNEKMPFFKKIGNSIIFIASNLLFGIKVRDTQTGFRAFTADAYKQIHWDSQRYSVASEIVINAKIRHLKQKEVTIKTIYHDEFKGTSMFDGIRIVYNMTMWRLKSWICFK